MKGAAVYKIFIILVVLFAFSFTDSFGQRWKFRRYEIGAGIGTMQMFADIGGTANQNNWFGLRDISFRETNLTASGNIRYKISPLMSFRTNINYGRGQGTDEGSRNDRGRSYKLSLYEISGQYEYYFLKEDKKYRSSAVYNRRGMLNNYNSFCAYLYLGGGIAITNSTHGEAEVVEYDNYKPGINVSPVVLFGVGVKYIIDDQKYINGDLGYRYGITDYLEGYKQTQGSKFNDVYYYISISFNYRLKTSRRNIPAFLDRKKGVRRR
jgi:hypothetical protein